MQDIEEMKEELDKDEYETTRQVRHADDVNRIFCLY